MKGNEQENTGKHKAYIFTDNIKNSWDDFSKHKASLKITDNSFPPLSIFKNLKEGSLRAGIMVFIYSVPGTTLGAWNKKMNKTVTVFKEVSEKLVLSIMELIACGEDIKSKVSVKNWEIGTSLMVQWLRIRLPMQGMWVWSLVG